jgi:hypothetical protein
MGLNFVNRKEAISLIKEIEDECKDIVGRSFVLVKPVLGDPKAAGYKVQVKAEFKANRSLCIEVIANRLGYSVENEPEKKTITIFESLERKKSKKHSEIEETGIM